MIELHEIDLSESYAWSQGFRNPELKTGHSLLVRLKWPTEEKWVAGVVYCHPAEGHYIRYIGGEENVKFLRPPWPGSTPSAVPIWVEAYQIVEVALPIEEPTTDRTEEKTTTGKAETNLACVNCGNGVWVGFDTDVPPFKTGCPQCGTDLIAVPTAGKTYTPEDWEGLLQSGEEALKNTDLLSFVCPECHEQNTVQCYKDEQYDIWHWDTCCHCKAVYLFNPIKPMKFDTVLSEELDIIESVSCYWHCPECGLDQETYLPNTSASHDYCFDCGQHVLVNMGTGDVLPE